jgi:hypothetical protein
MESSDKDALLMDDEEANTHQKFGPNRESSVRTIVHALVLAIAAFVLGAVSQKFAHFNGNAFCAQHTTQGTPPLLSDAEITYSTIQFNGSFMHPNVFRGDAGPETDAAWQSLGVDYRGIIVPKDKAAAAGLTTDHIQVSEKYGGGYPANVEGMHHLHCLNLLRQSLYYNFDHYKAIGDGAFKNNDYILKLHVTHCLDILRQQLMCTVDEGVFGQYWINPEEPVAFVDFNTKHKCKNYDAVRQWAEERQMPENLPKDFLVAPGPDSLILPETP